MDNMYELIITTTYDKGVRTKEKTLFASKDAFHFHLCYLSRYEGLPSGAMVALKANGKYVVMERESSCKGNRRVKIEYEVKHSQ